MDEIERLKKKLENYPSPSAYNRLAEIMRLHGKNEDAAELCQRCIREFPRNGQAYVIKAGIELSLGSKGIAIDTLTAGVKNDHRCYSGLRMLADLHVEAHNRPEAIRCLQKALELKPSDQGVERRLAELQASEPAASAQPTPQAPAPTPAPTRKQISETIDLSEAPVNKTTLNHTAAPAAPVDEPLAPFSMPLTTNAAPAPAPLPLEVTADPQTAHSSTMALSVLCAEEGVQSATVVDGQGRVIMSQGLAPGEDDLIAALSLDVTTSGADAINALGSQGLKEWSIETTTGKLLSFQDHSISIIINADSRVKMALLELRARQTLTLLGAGA